MIIMLISVVSFLFSFHILDINFSVLYYSLEFMIVNIWNVTVPVKMCLQTVVLSVSKKV